MIKKNEPGVTFPPKGKEMPNYLAAALQGEDYLQEFAKSVTRKETSKLLLLCQHFGIKSGPGMFYQLSLELARQLYPEPKKRGRKLKWTMQNMGALVVEVERIIKPDEPKYGISWACKQLATREPWTSFLEKKDGKERITDPGEAIRRIYYDFCKDRWAEVARDAFKMYEHENAIEEWESYVVDVVKNPNPN